MRSPVIRAITVAVDETGEKGLRRAISSLYAIRSCLPRVGVEAWTYRIVLPPLDGGIEECKQVAKPAASIPSDIIANIFGLVDEDTTRSCLPIILDYIEANPRLYSSILCKDPDCLTYFLESLWNEKRKPGAYTRIAAVLGSPILTPYFPATLNTGRAYGFMAAFRYAELALSVAEGKSSIEWLIESLRAVAGKLERLAECAGLDLLGIDYSLSPWMEESVAKIIETVAGSPLGSLGVFHGILQVNRLIETISAKTGVKPLGYNEAMLAVAEDNLLDQRVKEGRVRLRDLVAYSVFCVAGLDMVAVPAGLVDPHKLARDLWAVYHVKKRSLGVRVIPVKAEPGTEIMLEKFGATTVVSP